MTGPVVLSLCDRTGNMVEPWLEAGYQVVLVDLDGEDDQRHQALTVREDVRTWTGYRDLGPCCFGIAQPPCTHLARSGARWWAGKGPEALVEAMSVVDACLRILRACCPHGRWILENPVGRIYSYLGPPDWTFNPWEFAGWAAERDEGYTKRTCIWTGGQVRQPERRPFDGEPDRTRIHHVSPGPDRGHIRSVAPLGFARALFAANEPWVRPALWREAVT